MNCPHCQTLIDKHEASRCLDEWIAEKIMGWRRGPVFLDGVEIEVLHHPAIFREYNQYPHYSTSIAAAWEMVEKLEGSVLIGRHKKFGWVVDNSKNFTIYRGIADTASLAICRAAIKVTRES